MVTKDILTTTPFDVRAEQVTKLLPIGFIPNYPPDTFRLQLETLVAFKQKGFFGERDAEDITRVILNSNRRNEYDNENGYIPPELQTAQRIFPNILVFNQQTDASSEVRPISLNEEVFSDVRQLAIDFMRQQGDVIVAGFAGERPSVRGCLESAIDYVGNDHVIAVDAGSDPRATAEANKAGCKVLDQQTILRTCFDWQKMRELYGLPYSSDHIPSGKGTSHWVGAAYVDAKGLLNSEAHIIQKDTDVLNAHVWIPEIYLALTRIYAPQGDPVLFTQILRTGEGRNNEPWLYQANVLANARTVSKDQLGIALGSLTWPLSDARSGKWDVVRSFPITNSMGMETIRNVAIAGLSVMEGQRLIAQIVNSDQKIENMTSPPDREFNIVFHCAQLLRDLGTHVKETGMFPHQWGPDEIKHFNQYFGGERTLTFVPPKEQQANLLRFTRQEFILPSIKQMQIDGVVDQDRLRKM